MAAMTTSRPAARHALESDEDGDAGAEGPIRARRVLRKAYWQRGGLVEIRAHALVSRLTRSPVPSIGPREQIGDAA